MVFIHLKILPLFIANSKQSYILSTHTMINFLKSKFIIVGMFIHFLSPIVSFAQNNVKYGLEFKSYTYTPENRTSLILTPEEYFSFNSGFSISFNLLVHTDIYSYGYIFRMIDEHENCFDLLLSKGNIVFVSSMADDTNYYQKINFNQWMHIKIDFDNKKEEVTIYIDNNANTWKFPQLKDFRKVYIAFGKNDHSKIHAIDVAATIVKDLKINDISGKPLYSWMLSRYTDGGVYDDIKHHYARCENPSWIIDENGYWKKQFDLVSDRNPYVTYNPDNHEIAIADTNFFYRYNVSTNDLKKKEINSGISFPMHANQLIYNELDSNYYAYNLLKEEDARELAMFDMQTGNWAATTPHQLLSDYWHHNRYFSAKHRKLLLFGGYGHHKYKKDAYVYDLDTKTWSKVLFKGDTISPRYLSGMGKIDDDHLLIFGGYGSESGNQESLPQFYYDAYIVNIETMEARRIWTLDAPEENFVVSNSVVVDTVNRCFYALCFPYEKSSSTLSLTKFYLDNPQYERMADEIPFSFTDRVSYADLFFDRELERLIAIKYSSEAKNSKANVSLFTLAYPPLKQSELFQIQKSKIGWPLLVSIVGIILVIAVSVFFFLHSKKRRKAVNTEATETQTDESNPILGINTIKQLRGQSINLFGGFQVINRNKEDVTSEFMPLFTQLFLLILLYTIKGGRGVAFTKMKDILWPDKTEESANNNRGYALSKIRQILEQVGEVKFSKQNSFWSVSFGDDIYCDYYECLILMQQLKGRGNQNLKDIQRLLSIVSVGELLPNMQTEWLDSFKADFASELIDLLLDIAQQEDSKISMSMKMEISNAIFVHDALNEDALRIKCSYLVKMGKNGVAKNVYKSFVKEYKEWFGTEYRFGFEEVFDLS